MSILLWIVQALLAVHTLIGAGWKWFNPAQAVPTLGALPQSAWLALIPLEVICALGLVVPFLLPSLGWAVPVAALAIAAEMALFSVLHLRSGATDTGPLVYWGVVAGICVIVALGRWLAGPV